MINKNLQSKIDELKQLLLSLEALSSNGTLSVLKFSCVESRFSDSVLVSIEFSNESLAVCFYHLLSQFNIAVPSITRSKITFWCL